MYNLIKQATQEFEKNGRSEDFVKMENKLIRIGKPIQIYFFARYAKGANIKKLQKVMWDKATLEECFYFAYYVKGVKKDENGFEEVFDVNLVPFATRAVYEGDKFWIEKFAKLIKQRMQDLDNSINSCGDLNKLNMMKKEYGELENTIVPLMEEYGKVDFRSIQLGKEEYDIDRVIKKAKKEVSTDCCSDKFAQMEKQMKYNLGIGDFRAILFAKELAEYIKVKDFEKMACMSGEYDNIYMLAMRVDNVNKNSMLNALHLTKLDYVKEEEDNARLNARALMFNRNKVRNNENNIESYENTYQSIIDNCIAILIYRIKEEQKKLKKY